MDPDKKTEVDQFFENLPGEDKALQNIFDDKTKTDGDEPKPEPEERGEPRKNRRHRRLEEQLQREREMNIALNERVRVLAELAERKASPDGEPTEPPAEFLALYGNSPEAKSFWAIQQKQLDQVREAAKRDALAEIEARREAERKEQASYETLIDERLEALEDAHGVDLTSDAPQAKKARAEFLELVQRLSPKDERGAISAYADFDEAFELYRAKSRQPDPADLRRKEIAARSMQQSSPAPEQPKRRTYGWEGYKVDLGLD